MSAQQPYGQQPPPEQTPWPEPLTPPPGGWQSVSPLTGPASGVQPGPSYSNGASQPDYWQQNAGQQYPSFAPSQPQTSSAHYGQPPYPPQNQQAWAAPGSDQSGAASPFQPNFAAPGDSRRDPRTPIGGYTPAADAINNYQHTKSRRPLFITALVLAVIAAAVYFGSRSFSQPTASPTPTASTTTVDPANESGSKYSVPFDSGSTSGVWSITKYQWVGNQLQLTTTIDLSQGRLGPTFFALNNANPNSTYDPDGGTLQTGVVVEAGQPTTGTLTFTMPRGEATVFIANSNQRQITALVIPG